MPNPIQPHFIPLIAALQPPLCRPDSCPGMCPRGAGAGSGVGLGLVTHPLADLHLAGAAHLALNSKMSLTEWGRGCWPGAQAPVAGAGLIPGFLPAGEQGCHDPPKSPAGWLLTAGCLNLVLQIALITGLVGKTPISPL